MTLALLTQHVGAPSAACCPLCGRPLQTVMWLRVCAWHGDVTASEPVVASTYPELMRIPGTPLRSRTFERDLVAEILRLAWLGDPSDVLDAELPAVSASVLVGRMSAHALAAARAPHDPEPLLAMLGGWMLLLVHAVSGAAFDDTHGLARLLDLLLVEDDPCVSLPLADVMQQAADTVERLLAVDPGADDGPTALACFYLGMLPTGVDPGGGRCWVNEARRLFELALPIARAPDDMLAALAELHFLLAVKAEVEAEEREHLERAVAYLAQAAQDAFPNAKLLIGTAVDCAERMVKVSSGRWHEPLLERLLALTAPLEGSRYVPRLVLEGRLAIASFHANAAFCDQAAVRSAQEAWALGERLAEVRARETTATLDQAARPDEAWYASAAWFEDRQLAFHWARVALNLAGRATVGGLASAPPDVVAEATRWCERAEAIGEGFIDAFAAPWTERSPREVVEVQLRLARLLFDLPEDPDEAATGELEGDLHDRPRRSARARSAAVAQSAVTCLEPFVEFLFEHTGTHCGPSFGVVLAHAYRLLGHCARSPDEAQGWFDAAHAVDERLFARWPAHPAVAMSLAEGLVLAADTDGAMGLLQEAVANGNTHVLWLRQSIALRPLAEDAQFVEMLRRVEANAKGTDA